MRTCLILATLWLAWSLDAAAQGGFGSSNYEYIELRSVGTMEGNYQDGRFLHSMSDGVDMVFVAANPEDSLTIQAQTVEFRYADEETGSPSRIILEGDVVIVNSRNTIRSDHADIDFDSGDAVFTGNPRMDTEEVKNLRAKVINVNLKTGDYEMSSVRVEKLYLNRTTGGPGRNPYLLSESDVLDWRGFLERLKEEGGRPEPSPGKHLVALLDEQVRTVLLEVNVDALLVDPGAILKQLNKALILEQFYDKALCP